MRYLFAILQAMYFNGKGNRLALAQFNDTDVKEFYYTRYGDPEDPLKVQVRSINFSGKSHVFPKSVQIRGHIYLRIFNIYYITNLE